MTRKTKEQLENQLALQEALDVERAKSNHAYAIKLVERIVFSLVALMLTSVVVGLMSGVFRIPMQ